MSAPLSKELRTKHHIRSIPVRKDDEVSACLLLVNPTKLGHHRPWSLQGTARKDCGSLPPQVVHPHWAHPAWEGKRCNCECSHRSLQGLQPFLSEFIYPIALISFFVKFLCSHSFRLRWQSSKSIRIVSVSLLARIARRRRARFLFLFLTVVNWILLGEAQGGGVGLNIFNLRFFIKTDGLFIQDSMRIVVSISHFSLTVGLLSFRLWKYVLFYFILRKCHALWLSVRLPTLFKCFVDCFVVS